MSKLTGAKITTMKGAQLTIFRRSLKWLRHCKENGISSINYAQFLCTVDYDYQFSEDDLMVVYERLHNDGYLREC